MRAPQCPDARAQILAAMLYMWTQGYRRRYGAKADKRNGTLAMASGDNQPIPGEAISDYNPDPEIVIEPTVKVSAPSTNWVTVVVSDGNQYAMSELPKAAFTDPVLLRTIADMEREMRKANASVPDAGDYGSSLGNARADAGP